MSCSKSMDENFEKTINLIRDAANQGVQIVCTQELFKTHYFCQSEDWHHFELAEE
ncbi:MAG: carbon-nitrogen hydrolase, partial [Anaerolineales bacterium]